MGDSNQHRRVEALHWSAIPDHLKWSWGPGRLYFLWPSPVDEGSWLDSVGFGEIHSTNDRWEQDVQDMTSRLIAVLHQKGVPRLRVLRFMPWKRLSFFRVSDAWMKEALMAGCRDDRFQCDVEVGNPPVISLRTDGDFLWSMIRNPGSDEDTLGIAKQVAGGLPVKRTDLNWAKTQTVGNH